MMRRVLEETYLRCANIFSGSLDTARLQPSVDVNTHIPGVLDIVLYAEDAGNFATEMLSPLAFGPDNVGRQHLDISIPAEAAWIRRYG